MNPETPPASKVTPQATAPQPPPGLMQPPIPTMQAVQTPHPQVLAVPLPLAQALLEYLSHHPYAQVVGLINGIQQCQNFNVVENDQP